MKILLHLLKNNFIQVSRINQLRYADKQKRRQTMCIYILAVVVLVGLLAYWVYSLNTIFSLPWEANSIITSLILPMVLICCVLNIFISLFWGSGTLIGDANIDVQLAYPIPLILLVSSKLSVLYVVHIILDLLLLFPMIVLFGLTIEMSILYYLLMLGIVLLFPIIPCILGTMMGVGIYRILRSSSARIARLKTIVSIIMLFAFIIFMFWKFPDIVEGNIDFKFSLSAVSIFASKFVNRLLNVDYYALSIYIGFVFLVGYFLLCTLSNIYRNWYCNALNHATPQHIAEKERTFKKKKIIAALLAREQNRYFSLPVYLTNTACGLLFAVIFVLLIGLIPDKITQYIHLLAGYFQVAPDEYNMLYIYVLTILIVLSSTTYASISIEGKQMEIIKSLPITAEIIFRSKILFHLSVSAPVILFSNTTMALILNLPWEKVILGYIMPLLYSLFIGVVGCVLNIVFPNFEWENVTHIVKQSIPAILSALIGTFISCGTIYFLLKCYPNALLFGSYVMCSVLIVLIAIIVRWLDVEGVHRYKNL